MRVAIVSPYSWTYPGGVVGHIEQLTKHLIALGHDVRVLSPFDHETRATAIAHMGYHARHREAPEWLIELGSTVGLPRNGAMSNLSFSPFALAKLRRSLRHGEFDVVHLHEPVAPMICWHALKLTNAPIVGTFHCYSEDVVAHTFARLAGARRRLDRLDARIAVSAAAAWTGRRFFGGYYEIIPNGVVVTETAGVPKRQRSGEPLHIVFIGQALARKGLPVLLRAFEQLRERRDVALTIVGPSEKEVERVLTDLTQITVLGCVSNEEKQAALTGADVLCAPSLRGESFGMVLTEAFAAGTPVVASDIAGYRDVVRDGENGLLISPGESQSLANTLECLSDNPDFLFKLAQGARASAELYSWSHVTEKVLTVYEDVIVAANDTDAKPVRAIDRSQKFPPRRLPSLEPRESRRRRNKWARRIGIVVALAIAITGSVIAIDHIGFHKIENEFLKASPYWLIVALFVMGFAMTLRGVAWYAILRAAVPETRPHLSDAMQGTFIGVLMSATLPARMGEVARAIVVGRRLGEPREYVPAVLGTVVAQTVLNVVAIIILGVITVISGGLFNDESFLYLLIPVALLIAGVIILPLVVRTRNIRNERARKVLVALQNALVRVRTGLHVFLTPKWGIMAAVFQLGAWAAQTASCYILFLALDVHAHFDAAAAVLFAVNVSAAIPVTPGNVGVFQLAAGGMLRLAFGVPADLALAYGVLLQAVEVVTAIVMGVPAMLREGVSWRDIRMRSLTEASPKSANRSAAKRPQTCH